PGPARRDRGGVRAKLVAVRQWWRRGGAPPPARAKRTRLPAAAPGAGALAAGPARAAWSPRRSRGSWRARSSGSAAERQQLVDQEPDLLPARAAPRAGEPEERQLARSAPADRGPDPRPRPDLQRRPVPARQRLLRIFPIHEKPAQHASVQG